VPVKPRQRLAIRELQKQNLRSCVESEHSQRKERRSIGSKGQKETYVKVNGKRNGKINDDGTTINDDGLTIKDDGKNVCK